MMISIATGVGLQHKIREKIAGFKGHVQVVAFNNNTSEITDYPVALSTDLDERISRISGIEHVQAYATKFGILRTEKSFQGIVFKGVDSLYDWSFFKSYLRKGRLPKLGSKRSFEILMSEKTAGQLGLELGSTINTYFLKDEPGKLPNRRQFKVVGFYDTGYEEFDESFVLGDLKIIQQLNKWKDNQVGGIEILLDDFDQIQPKGVEIYNAMDSNLTSSTILEEFPAIFDWLALFDNNIAVILVIMVMIAGINMITALLVLILERTQMIGILKSLGSRNRSIAKIFLYNASYLIFRGMIWGNMIGIGLLLIQSQFELISLDPETYYVNTVPVHLSLDYILALNFGTLALCMLMLLLPTLIISKIDPVKVIRFD